MARNNNELKHILRIEELLESEEFHYKKYDVDYAKDTMNEKRLLYDKVIRL